MPLPLLKVKPPSTFAFQRGLTGIATLWGNAAIYINLVVIFISGGARIRPIILREPHRGKTILSLATKSAAPQRSRVPLCP
jgi:hypothetical protein